MVTIYLLRHCVYDNPRNIIPGRLPVELSEQGKMDALNLRTFFADKQISRIYSSAVLRCQQTAEIISDGRLPIQFDKRLLETSSAYQGFWDKNTPDGNEHFYKHLADLGGESMSDTQTRTAIFWDEVIASTSENILICSHGDPLICLYYHLQNMPAPPELTPDAELLDFLEKGEFWQVELEGGQIQGQIQKRNIIR